MLKCQSRRRKTILQRSTLRETALIFNQNNLTVSILMGLEGALLLNNVCHNASVQKGRVGGKLYTI